MCSEDDSDGHSSTKKRVSSPGPEREGGRKSHILTSVKMVRQTDRGRKGVGPPQATKETVPGAVGRDRQEGLREEEGTRLGHSSQELVKSLAIMV